MWLAKSRTKGDNVLFCVSGWNEREDETSTIREINTRIKNLYRDEIAKEETKREQINK